MMALEDPFVPVFLNLIVRDVFAVPSTRNASPSAKTLNPAFDGGDYFPSAA